ncbi:unnamed protein product [Cyclocybe aegerita]|uniref:Uncharacterized protein n=1 Tax=Cyclocybe aegerita TaxID=1973307 RepID=A0A8S0WWI4_CYCAE|nr:unnamed protein product [Cyclocybe aegerita]
MPQYDGPIVDEQNPFYCPSIPADSYHQFLKEARQMLNTERPPDHDIFHSYQRALEKSLSKSDDGGSVCKMDWIRDDPMPPDCAWPSSQPAPGSDELPPYSSVELTRAPAKPRHNTALDSEAAKSLLQLRERQPDFKKKLSDSFSDFEAPPQYARSMVSFHNSSFEFEVSRKGLNFFTASSSPTARVDAYLHSTMDNIGHLIDQLDRALPGIRLAERLRCQPRATPQSIMDFLVENGILIGIR